jgi:hypothetical protein
MKLASLALIESDNTFNYVVFLVVSFLGEC